MGSIKTPPKTTMEVFKKLPEGTLAEIIDGSISMSPTPNPQHQKISLCLIDVILQFIKPSNPRSHLFHAPCDVFLDEYANAVQPDIILILPEHSGIVKKDAIHGVPDMLVEILPKGNSDHDRIRKKDLYEKFGVHEYWLVDPETKETLGFTLADGKYRELGRYTGKIHSAILGNTSFDF